MFSTAIHKLRFFYKQREERLLLWVFGPESPEQKWVRQTTETLTQLLPECTLTQGFSDEDCYENLRMLEYQYHCVASEIEAEGLGISVWERYSAFNELLDALYQHTGFTLVTDLQSNHISMISVALTSQAKKLRIEGFTSTSIRAILSEVRLRFSLSYLEEFFNLYKFNLYTHLLLNRLLPVLLLCTYILLATHSVYSILVLLDDRTYVFDFYYNQNFSTYDVSRFDLFIKK